ncbi:MAG: carboxyl transferase [Lachnospiraceae bacterium]|nr:carboxyl transferase [Lachnospiraceae bacterium]
MSTNSQARQRIASLLDENSFVEIGARVTARNTDFNLKQTQTPSDGVITGYGVIGGNLVYVYSQDASVLNGSVGEMHAKKIVNLYDMAIKMGAPVIGLIESSGLRLQEATDALNAFGEIYLRQAYASGVIPQINAIFGNCGGALAIASSMADFTFMEEKNAKLFVTAPNCIDGNSAEKCDTSAASFQAKETGNVDFAGSEEEVFDAIRELVCILPANNAGEYEYEECEDDLNRACPSLEASAEDPVIALSQISDNAVVFETKKEYAKEVVTAFIKLNGATVGAVANRTVLYDENGEVVEKFEPLIGANGCEKAAEFVNFCDAFEIPVLTVTNIKGFKTCKCNEKRMAKAAAKLTYAFAEASVPKVNLITRQAFGSAYVMFNSKSIGADITIAWPDAVIGSMDSKLAAQIICEGQGSDAINECAKEYDSLQNNVESAAKRGYVDEIVEPADTRKYVIGAFEMLYSKFDAVPDKKHGTV